MQGKKPANSKNSFGDRLRASRESAGVSRSDLARRIGLSNPSQISRYEAGKGFPTFEALVAISETLPVDLHWLLTGTPSPAVITIWKAVSGGLKHVLIHNLNLLLEEEIKHRNTLLTCADPDAERVASAELDRVKSSMKSYTSVLQWLQQDAQDLIGPDGFVRFADIP